MRRRPIPNLLRSRPLAALVLIVALAATACGTSGGGAMGGLGGGYAGGGSGSSSGGNEAAGGTEGFDPIKAPRWDDGTTGSGDAGDGTDGLGSTGAGGSSSSTGSGGSSGSGSSSGSSGASSSSTGSSSSSSSSGSSGSSGSSSGSGATGAAEAVSGAGDSKVFVLGDSVLLAAKDMLPAQLPGWDVTVDAKVSRRIDAGIAVAQERRSEMGAVVVVHLCTNYAKGEGFAKKLDRLMEILAGVPRVVLVTCVTWSDGQPEANAAIAAAADRYPAVRVADWASIARAAGNTGGDGIHLLPPGVITISKLIAAQVGPAPNFAGPDITVPAITVPAIDD